MLLKFHSVKMTATRSILNNLFANQQKWVKGSSAEEANKNLQKFLEPVKGLIA